MRSLQLPSGLPERQPAASSWGVVGRPSTTALAASYLAAFLAIASATVTAYWMLGGTALLDTLGGELERFARNRSIDALLLALSVVVAKAAAWGIALALALARRPPRRLTSLAAVAGALLALYGAVLTLAGVLAMIGVIGLSSPKDEHALRWHAFSWAPWFLIWGWPWRLRG